MSELRDEAPGKRAPLFYGWYIVAAAFVVMTVSAGLGFYNLGVYLKAFVAERDFAVSVTSAATASFFISSGLTGLVVGAYIEKHDPRWSVLAGAVIASAAMFGVRWVEELWQLYAFHILFGAGYAACALLPCTTLVARWFNEKRSIALSYASTGLSVGGILLTPLSAKLIDIGGIGWAAQWLALIFFIGIVPVSLLVFRPSPASMGLRPDGAAVSRDEKGNALPEAAAEGADFGAAVRSRLFLFMVAAFVFAMMAQVGTIAHLFRLVATRTGSDDTASLAVALMAGSSIAGRLIGGQVLTRLPARPFVLALTLVQGSALVFYAFAQSEAALFAVALLFGTSVGNLLMMQPLIVAEAFGLKAYGRLFSWSQFAMTLGVASGPAMIGFIYEKAGGYQPAFLLMAAASLAAFFCLLAAGSFDVFRKNGWQAPVKKISR